MNFKFFNGKITLEQYLSKYGYNNMWEFEHICDYFDQLDWYNEVVSKFNYNKDEDVEYQEHLRINQEIMLNHVSPIDDDGLPF